jgi:hypothetical protein
VGEWKERVDWRLYSNKGGGSLLARMPPLSLSCALFSPSFLILSLLQSWHLLLFGPVLGNGICAPEVMVSPSLSVASPEKGL